MVTSILAMLILMLKWLTKIYQSVEYNTNLFVLKKGYTSTPSTAYIQSESENCLWNITHVIIANQPRNNWGKIFYYCLLQGGMYWDIFPFITLHFNGTTIPPSIHRVNKICCYITYFVLFIIEIRETGNA